MFQENILNLNIKFMSLITNLDVYKGKKSSIYKFRLRKTLWRIFVSKQHNTYFYTLHFKNASVNNSNVDGFNWIQDVMLKMLN